MYQLYYLSITINLIVGIVLARGVISGKFPSFGKFLEDIGECEIFRLGGGIAATAVGILKLLLVTQGDLVIVGDLFPALIGIVVGATLLFEYLREKRSGGLPPWMNRTGDFLVAGKRIWGIAAVAAAVLHFFFNQALFL
jgi:hypothetical protein